VDFDGVEKNLNTPGTADKPTVLNESMAKRVSMESARVVGSAPI